MEAINIKNDLFYTDFSLYESKIVKDESAVLNSIVNLLQTGQYERFFNPEAYIEWDDIMANLNMDIVMRYYEKQIEEMIPMKEPRVKKAVCKMYGNKNEPHTVYIEMSLYLKDGEQIKEFLKISLGE